MNGINPHQRIDDIIWHYHHIIIIIFSCASDVPSGKHPTKNHGTNFHFVRVVQINASGHSQFRREERRGCGPEAICFSVRKCVHDSRPAPNQIEPKLSGQMTTHTHTNIHVVDNRTLLTNYHVANGTVEMDSEFGGWNCKRMDTQVPHNQDCFLFHLFSLLLVLVDVLPRSYSLHWQVGHFLDKLFSWQRYAAISASYRHMFIPIIIIEMLLLARTEPFVNWIT